MVVIFLLSLRNHHIFVSSRWSEWNKMIAMHDTEFGHNLGMKIKTSKKEQKEMIKSESI